MRWLLRGLVGSALVLLVSVGDQARGQTHGLEGSVWEAEDETGVGRLERRADSTFQVLTPDVLTPFTGQYVVDGKHVRMRASLPAAAEEPRYRNVVLLLVHGVLVVPDPEPDEKQIQFRQVE